ncbi:MAG: DUF1330 domain-containing protein [Alphaproteobacteria bacterium]|nr:DUF1330 domain-containing protein [Alphaproteobacteria bacterium]
MPGYLIARVQVHDMEQYKQYMALSPGALEAYGGRFIVRGGAHETLEGPEETGRLVVVEFPSVEQARACYDSARYREAKAKRAGAADMQMVVVEGV